MKKLVIAACAGLIALSALPPAAAGGGKHQHVEGTIALPTKHPEGCYPGLHRRVAVATNEAVNGVIGYHFDVEKGTWNKPFVLEVTGGQGYVDLDINFYSEFGTLEQATDTGYAPYNVAFKTRSANGESGRVPKETHKVIVCMYADETQTPGAGANASFSYMAGKGVKLPKD